MHGLGLGCPLAGINNTGLVGPASIRFACVSFSCFLKRPCDGAPNELRALTAAPRSHGFELFGGPIIKLDEDLFQLIHHMIQAGIEQGWSPSGWPKSRPSPTMADDSHPAGSEISQAA
jgi:hypothetical protein